MSRVTAMNYYMRPYQAAVEAGVGSITVSYTHLLHLNAFRGVRAISEFD